MSDLEHVLDTPPFSTIAETFLEQTTLKELPELIRSLCQVYVARALEIEPSGDKVAASWRLLNIALAMESQLFRAMDDTYVSPDSSFLEAYGVLSRILEYGGRMMEQVGKDSTELWMRASVAFALGQQSANSRVAARHCLENFKAGEHYTLQMQENILRFLAGELQSVIERGPKTTQSLRTEAFAPQSSSSIQERLRAVGCLELLEALLSVASFLRLGNQETIQGWRPRFERAEKLLHESGDSLLEWLARRLKRICSENIVSSLWSLRALLPIEYIQSKTSGSADQVFTLWRSQMEAANSILRPHSKRHQSIVMPTSSGKTLVAEMAIVKELHGTPASAFYVAPTRALVNEITQQLSRHLPQIGIGVTKLPGDYEHLPGLDSIFRGPARVYTMTPEKLDLLWRIDDKRLADARVFVFDETQLIKETGRGLRFELLISKIKANYGNKARIILLSAVIPPSNLEEFVRWLDRDNTQSLDIAWRPTRNLEAFFYRAKLHDWKGVVHYLERFEIDNVLPANRKSSARENTIALAWKYQKFLGPVLVYCPTKNEAEATAQGLLELAQESTKANPVLQSSADGVATILGKNFPLVGMIRHGIAYHHGSLAEPVRLVIESLAREGKLRILTCTSTLAEGVNLNVRTVIVSSARAGEQEMDGARLRNLAGRAGRALKDTEGHVILMYPQLEKMLRDRESAKILSRFFRYVDEKQETPGFNKDVDVVEAELLALLFKGHIASANLHAQIQHLMTSTLFSRQAEIKKFASARDKVEGQARAIFSNKTLSKQQLEVFATTGLNLEFCQQLDEEALEIASLPDLSFRIEGRINDSLVERVCSKCLLESDHFEARTKKKIIDQGTIVMGWLTGESLLRLAAKIEKPPTNQMLTMLSNYLYGYVAEDVSWACSAFVKLLKSHLSQVQRPRVLDSEWDLLPTYLRYGVCSPAAVLLLTSGFGNRDQAMRMVSGKFTAGDPGEDWLRHISRVLSLPPVDEPMREAQGRILAGLGAFAIQLPFSTEMGSIDIDDEGRILRKGEEIGKIREDLVSLFVALRTRGFLAETHRAPNGDTYIQVIPSVFRALSPK